MGELYPKIEPSEHGMLDVGDGNQVYWETCGNTAGKPAMVLHGGPGSGCTPGWRRYFDPRLYRIVLFDQRGCGRSTPSAADSDVDLSTNTTYGLLAEIERLRQHLAIDRWLVFGGSWGSILGLAYAPAHPERVTEIVLFSVVTTTHCEVEWITRDMGRIFPAEWARFLDQWHSHESKSCRASPVCVRRSRNPRSYSVAQFWAAQFWAPTRSLAARGLQEPRPRVVSRW